jgi:O-antigen/teichoic acid export membrane protein
MALVKLIRSSSGRYARGSLILFGWMLLRAGALATTVVMVATALGVKAYGEFVSVVAIASFLTPFVGLGLPSVLLRDGARDPARLDSYLGKVLRGWGYSLIPCLLTGSLVAALLLPRGVPLPWAIFTIMVDMASTSLTELRARHLQAQQRVGAFGAVNAGLILLRLAALAALLKFSEKTGSLEALQVYAASSMLYLILILMPMLFKAWNSPAPVPMGFSSGLPFSLAAFSTRVQTEFNKPILARHGFDLAGGYNVAQRGVDVVSLPLTALQEALWPRLYAHSDPRHQLYVLGGFLLVVAAFCSLLVWSLSPWLADFLGPDFVGAGKVMRDLAWLPVLQAFRGLANFRAVHLDRLHTIGWTYGLGALASMLCVTWFVPRYGMDGAVASAYLTEVIMIVLLLLGSRTRSQS